MVSQWSEDTQKTTESILSFSSLISGWFEVARRKGCEGWGNLAGESEEKEMEHLSECGFISNDRNRLLDAEGLFCYVKKCGDSLNKRDK